MEAQIMRNKQGFFPTYSSVHPDSEGMPELGMQECACTIDDDLDDLEHSANSVADVEAALADTSLQPIHPRFILRRSWLDCELDFNEAAL
jgi:hypothetical protein